MRGISHGEATVRSMDADRVRAFGIATTRGVGPVLLGRLLGQFGTLEAVFLASTTELQAVAGIGATIAQHISTINLDKLGTDLITLDKQGIKVTLWGDSDYPVHLLRLPDRPLVLFSRGTLATLYRPTIAIVGTRTPSQTALRLAALWAGRVARRGWAVVSGLARGIDSQAHWAAIQAGASSIAILGSGLNRIYPPENNALAERIVEQGVLLSEVHPNTHVAPNMLMYRNRLISGLSRAVFVVECGETSGAMEAARRAQSQGRPVIVWPTSAGTRWLAHEFASPLPVDMDTWLAQLEPLEPSL